MYSCLGFTLSHYSLHNFILFLIVQLTMDDVSSETCFASLKHELQKHPKVHQSDIIIIMVTIIIIIVIIIIIIIIIIVITICERRAEPAILISTLVSNACAAVI